MKGELDKIEFANDLRPGWVKCEFAERAGPDNGGTLFNWFEDTGFHKMYPTEQDLVVVNGDVVADDQIWADVLMGEGNMWVMSTKEMMGGFMWRIDATSVHHLYRVLLGHQEKWIEYSLAALNNWRIYLTDRVIFDIDSPQDIEKAGNFLI